MATDIAFAVGVLALLGRRVPPALRVLLLALAVIDDLGAIIVIAVFYSGGLNPAGFALAGGGLLGIVALRALGVRQPSAYVLPAVVAWAGTYVAGIHPTIAGVIVGLMTPVRAWLGPEGYAQALSGQLAALDAPGAVPDDHTLALRVRGLAESAREAVSPAESLIARLHPWVAFGIMPVFALANAGVPLEGMSLEGAAGGVAAGCAVGLVLGKPVGILAACGAALGSGLARLPVGIGRRHLVVLGVVAGIGFTMSLFIAQLAFASPALLGAAKLGVLAGTGVAGVLGVGLGLALLRPLTSAGPARTADEAEGSSEV
jgi:NhaA family Na+:H+ antiporter